MMHGTYHDELDPGSAVTLATLPTPATMGHYKKKLADRLIPKPGAHNPERSTAINSCNGVFTSEFIFT